MAHLNGAGAVSLHDEINLEKYYRKVFKFLFEFWNCRLKPFYSKKHCTNSECANFARLIFLQSENMQLKFVCAISLCRASFLSISEWPKYNYLCQWEEFTKSETSNSETVHNQDQRQCIPTLIFVRVFTKYSLLIPGLLKALIQLDNRC